MTKVLVAGDTIIDWVISEGKMTASAGGVGNVVRGLMDRNIEVELLTLYNPVTYPLGQVLDLHPATLTDLTHTNVFTRNYDTNIHQRFRKDLKSGVLDVEADVVVCHEDSAVRKFKAFYADVRDGSVRGECRVLRMSSSDDTETIMKRVEHEYAIITHRDYVEVKRGGRWETIPFPPVKAIDDIGAGDSFNVGFLDFMLKHGKDLENFRTAVKMGIQLAQIKVQKVGVFI